MATEESRTFLLDKDLLNDLASPDYVVREGAMAELPEALSRVEVSDIGIQVSLVPGVDAIRKGERLEKQVLFHLGLVALIKGGDLVTAASVAKELRSKGDLVGWFMLARRLRQARKQILDSLVSGT